tara:strand:- start:531 stop:1448 length:918 start_codon:yes stop_codon:yes gene_type:complete
MKARNLARANVNQYLHPPLKRHFGLLRPDQISSHILNEFRALYPTKQGVLREQLLELRHALSFAKKNGWIEVVPLISVPGKRPPRDRFITRDEANELLEAAKVPHVRLFILIAMISAARKSAILGLTWDRVNFEAGTIDFNDPTLEETRKRRSIVPIGSEVVEILRQEKVFSMSGYVIEFNGKPVKDIKTGFQAACKSAGLKKVSPHTLKHSVISWLAQEGFTVDQIADLTATSVPTIRRVYRKVAPQHLRPMAENLVPNGNIANMFAKPFPDAKPRKERNPLVSQGVSMVELRGIEPLTSTMPL